LNWGAINLNFTSRKLDELRRKYIELNVTMRQVGIDDEKNFIDERITMGERLLTKDY